MRLVYLASFLTFFAVGCGYNAPKAESNDAAPNVTSVETTDHVAEANSVASTETAANVNADAECVTDQQYCKNCKNCPSGGNCPQNCPNCPSAGSGSGSLNGAGNCPIGDILGQLGGGSGLPTGSGSGLPTVFPSSGSGGENCPLGGLIGQLGQCP